MARTGRVTAPPPGVTAERAARLCRLLRLVGSSGQSRAILLRRLKLDIRSFYRDVKMLRDVGIFIELKKGKYVLQGSAEEVIPRIPFPDPHLTLGEARVLGKGRSAVHRKIRAMLAQIL